MPPSKGTNGCRRPSCSTKPHLARKLWDLLCPERRSLDTFVGHDHTVSLWNNRNRMVVRNVICLILLAAPANAEWQRYMAGRLDSPPSHDLAYFRVHPCLRIDAKDRVRLWCGTAPTASELEALPPKTYTKLSNVGRIGSLTVYDLYYFFDGPEDPDNPTKPAMRSVLVKSGLNQIHEIHVDDNRGGTFIPTRIIRIGHSSILRIRYDDGGMYGMFREDYFVVSEAGTAPLDFAPIFQSASDAIPDDVVTYQPTSGFDFKTMVFRIWTEKRTLSAGPKISCCVGRVEVPFTIRLGRVIPGVARYFADARLY